MSARCGRSGRWSRRGRCAARCTCCPPPSCRATWPRSAACARAITCRPGCAITASTAREADAMLAAIPRALDGRALTREELAAAVAGRPATPALAAKLRERLRRPAQAGRLHAATSASRPATGQRVRFTRPADWLGELAGGRAGGGAPPSWRAATSPPTARRPASSSPRWFGMSSAAPRPGAAPRARRRGREVDLEGSPAWMLAPTSAEAAAAEPAGVVRLLPAFDHYVVAAPRDARRGPARGLRGRVYRPQGWLSPVLLARRPHRRRLVATSARAAGSP